MNEPSIKAMQLTKRGSFASGPASPGQRRLSRASQLMAGVSVTSK